MRLSSLERLEKRAALVPLPCMPLVRSGGCLAPHSHLRCAIYPDPAPARRGRGGDRHGVASLELGAVAEAYLCGGHGALPAAARVQHLLRWKHKAFAITFESVSRCGSPSARPQAGWLATGALARLGKGSRWRGALQGSAGRAGRAQARAPAGGQEGARGGHMRSGEKTRVKSGFVLPILDQTGTYCKIKTTVQDSGRYHAMRRSVDFCYTK